MSILNSKEAKKKCQHFTADKEVKHMLSLAGYKARSKIIGKKVLENSFGNGNILEAIVVEYIKACRINQYSNEAITRELSQNIYGFELDKELYSSTINRLNRITADQGITNVNWKLFNIDALSWNGGIKFDYIIGNPPYVAYYLIDGNTRLKLQNEFISCQQGKYDYCYAFIEFSLRLLSDKGKMVQLVPNSIFKNQSAEVLRTLLLPHIKQIDLYPGQSLFDETLISACVFLYDSAYNGNTIRCINKTMSDKYSISKNDLHEKWVLSNSREDRNGIRFGDYFHASNSIATLYNDAFIISENEARSLEQEVVRRAASPKSLRFNKKYYIIFPYSYRDGVLSRYDEEFFMREFPRATIHLNNYRDELLSRSSDKHAKWFEYGRSQALRRIHQEKLLLSSIITNNAEVYRLDYLTVPYTGIFITSLNNGYNLDRAEEVLRSNDFADYARSKGISINGNSVRITCKDINDYVFNVRENDGRS